MGPDDVCFLWYEARLTEFFVIWAIFCTFTPLTIQKIKTLKKWKKKKTPGEIIILHKCTKNHDHMLYCSWDMACDGSNCYFSFWAIFCPFTPLTVQKKSNFFKNERNTWKYSHTCSNNLLNKMTTRLRRPMLSPLELIPIQTLLYQTTTCLTQLATTLFVPQMIKNLFKTATAKL